MLLGSRAVTTPDGVQWRIGRRLLTRRFGWSWRRRGDIASASFSSLGGSSPDLLGADLGASLLFVAAAVAVVVVLIPILFFGVELVVGGALLAAGIISRVVLRRPWVIEARSSDPLTPGRVLEWEARGWRQSSRLIDEVARDLAAGRDPPISQALAR
jgi:hypothetical protein